MGTRGERVKHSRDTFMLCPGLLCTHSEPGILKFSKMTAALANSSALSTLLTHPSAGRARTRSRTPRLRSEKGPIARSLGAMVSACSHRKTSLQNLPGMDRGEGEEKKQILVTKEK